MLFEVLTGKGLSNNVTRSGDRQAVVRQTMQEHNDLMDPAIQFPVEYSAALRMPPGPQRSALLDKLKMDAVTKEQEDPRYWNDEKPRRFVSQSSSFIGDIDYSPETNMAMVQMGDKVYPYAANPNQMTQWLNSPSMEKYYWQNFRNK